MRAAAALVAALALTACGGNDGHASVAQQRAWVESVQEWMAVEAFQGDFRNCGERIANRVGDAPDAELEPLEHRLTGLCSRFEHAYRDLDRAFKTDDADLYARSQTAMRRAEAQISTVRAAVDAWQPGSDAAGLPRRGGIVTSSRIEPRFSSAASAIAHRDVTVRCWSKRDWPRIERVARAEGSAVTDLAGLADPTTEIADLAPEVCRDLVDLAYRGVHTGVQAAFGLQVLSHEATHLREDAGSSEAVTECYAMQRSAEGADELGLRPGEASALAATYWADIYPEVDPEYFTGDCRDGGPLDLDAASGRWP
jgi:hypothetical protein